MLNFAKRLAPILGRSANFALIASLRRSAHSRSARRHRATTPINGFAAGRCAKNRESAPFCQRPRRRSHDPAKVAMSGEADDSACDRQSGSSTRR